MVGSPSNLVATGSPPYVVATGSPPHVVAESPPHVVAESPPHVVALSPSRVGANHRISQETQRNYQTNTSISQEIQRNYEAKISQFKQAIIDFKSIIASDSSNTQTYFDIVFLDTFPDVAANYQSKDNKELSERENIAVCPVNTSQRNEEHDSSNTQTDFDKVFLDTFPDVAANYQSKDNIKLSERENIAIGPVNTSQRNKEHDRNVTAQHHLSSDPLEICSDNDVV